MFRAFPFGAALASLLVLANCATSPEQTASDYYVSISSSANAEVETARSYELVPMDSAISRTDADFVEYASYVEHALAEKGLTHAAPGAQPDMLILLRYGTDEPKKQVRAKTTADFDHVAMNAQGAEFSSAASSSGAGSASISSASRAGPTTHFAIGSDIGPKTYTTYTHFILLDGYLVDPARDAGNWQKAFETDIGSTGTSGDLHQVFPYMIAATLDVIAASTDGVFQTVISDSDERLNFVRGVPTASAP